MKGNNFHGTGMLSRMLLRQNWLRMLIWIVSLVSISVIAAVAYIGVYQNESDLMGFALTMKNPAMIAMLGPGYELADYHLGALFSNEMMLFTLIAVGVMNIQLASRSTRVDEEEGRLEWIRSLPIGRLSTLAATVIQMVGVNVLLALAMGLSLSLVNIESMTFSNSLLYGSALGSVGFFFAMLTVLFAQLAETSRGTSLFAYGFLLLAYILRAIGDVEENVLSFLSPLGMSQRTSPFVGNEWWPVLILIVSALVLFSFSLYFNRIRDLGSGLLPSRKGRDRASAFLQSVGSLFWRLERTTILSWAIGLFFLSVAFGAIIQELERYFSDLAILEVFLPEIPGITLTEQFLLLLILIISIFSVLPVVSVTLRPRKEEKLSRMDHYYSRTIGRSRVLATSYLWAIATGIFMQTAILAGLYLGASEAVQGSLNWGSVSLQVAWYLFGIRFVITLTLFMVGWFPKQTWLAWGYAIWCFLVAYLADLLEFPNWLKHSSVFQVVPTIPFENIQTNWLIGYGIGGLVLTVLAFIGYNRRDIEV